MIDLNVLLQLADEFNLPVIIRQDHIVICGQKEFLLFLIEDITQCQLKPI